MDDRTLEDRTVARCIIDHLNSGPEGPGFYYCVTDGDGDETGPIGPFDSKEEAETAFTSAMEEAVTELVKRALGLED